MMPCNFNGGQSVIYSMSIYFGWFSKMPEGSISRHLFLRHFMGVLFTWKRPTAWQRKNAWGTSMQLLGWKWEGSIFFSPLKDTEFFYGSYMILKPQQKQVAPSPFICLSNLLYGKRYGALFYILKFLFIIQRTLRTHISSQFHQQQSMNRMHLWNQWGYNSNQRCADTHFKMRNLVTLWCQTAAFD